jgi:hypothetical protein
VNISVGRPLRQLTKNRLRFRDLLRFKPLSLKHVQEVRVPTKVKLIRPIQPNASFPKVAYDFRTDPEPVTSQTPISERSAQEAGRVVGSDLRADRLRNRSSRRCAPTFARRNRWTRTRDVLAPDSYLRWMPDLMPCSLLLHSQIIVFSVAPRVRDYVLYASE